jgi:Flp pilus assembly pilin Flp
MVLKDEEGQAVTEYILLMAGIVSIYLIVTAAFVRIGIAKKFMAFVTQGYAATYQYGHPKAKGYKNGGPEFHPRANGGQNNFRLFFNPEQK